MWLSPDEATSEPFSSNAAEAWALADTCDLCITGDSLTALQDMGAATTYIPLAQVCAACAGRAVRLGVLGALCLRIALGLRRACRVTV